MFLARSTLSRSALALMLLCLPAHAQESPGTPLTGDQFEAYVAGKTITYHQFGQPYGVEQYLSDRRVQWAFTETECRVGHWYQQDESICFVYEYDPEPQCWVFWMDARGLNGLYNGNPPGSELTEVSRNTDPLPCPGPDVGV